MKSPLINVFLFFATILISGAFDSSEGMNAGHIIEEKSTLEVDHSSFRVQTTCTTPYGSGTCIDTASCGGFSVSGYCSGAANIQCCITAACNPPAGSGTCKENTKTCSGTYYSGYCPGPSNVQCCVASTGGGGTACTTPYGSGVCESTSACTGSAVPGYCSGDSSIQCCVPKISITAAQKGIDISVALSASTATCWAPSIAFIIVRGYQSLGQVDPAMCGSLTSATNAGIKNRDVYIFPCPTCSKSAATQMNELVTYINGHCKAQFSGRVWLDIEGTQVKCYYIKRIYLFMHNLFICILFFI